MHLLEGNKEKTMSLMSDIVGKIFHPAHAKTPEMPNPPPPMQGTTPPTSSTVKVDVVAVLSALEKKQALSLNWRTSIVDLLKLLGLDSSLAARQKLADELHFTGDKANSAEMNVWLIHKVMEKLAESGGKVPEELKH
jgi:hypothetical protein